MSDDPYANFILGPLMEFFRGEITADELVKAENAMKLAERPMSGLIITSLRVTGDGKITASGGNGGEGSKP